MGQGLLSIEDSWSHSDTPHSVGLLWTSDLHMAETSTWQDTTVTTDIHEPGGIRTRNSSKQAATDSRPRLRSHWDQQSVHLMYQIHAFTVYNITVTSIWHVLAGQFNHQEVHYKSKTIHSEMNNIYVLSVHSAANTSVYVDKICEFPAFYDTIRHSGTPYAVGWGPEYMIIYILPLVKRLVKNYVLYIYIYIYQIYKCVIMPISDSARCKAWFFGCLLAEIVGSNPSGSLVVCLLWVLCDVW